MTDQRREVDRQLPLEGVEPLVEGLPPPLDALLEGRHRQVLDLAEHAAQPVALLGLERRQRQRAVAGDDAGDAVLEGGLGEPVPAQLGVVVGVDVDEPRRQGEAPAVDLDGALLGHPPDLHDAAVAHADLAPVGRHAGAVVDDGIADHEIEHRFLP